ncbi:MAG: hypothetical protein RRY53_08180, partial [Pseudoflavonifractor sp.]
MGKLFFIQQCGFSRCLEPCTKYINKPRLVLAHLGGGCLSCLRNRRGILSANIAGISAGIFAYAFPATSGAICDTTAGIKMIEHNISDIAWHIAVHIITCRF